MSIVVHGHVHLVSLGHDKIKVSVMLFLPFYEPRGDGVSFEAKGMFFHFLSSIFLNKAFMWADLLSI